MKKTTVLLLTILCFYQIKAQHNKPNAQQNHAVVIDSILQTTNYTYLLGRENNVTTWLAVPLLDAEVGKMYYYVGGMDMNNFASKELKRTFEVVKFLGGVSDMPLDGSGVSKKDEKPYQRVVPKENKIEINIATTDDCISIKELFSNKDKYAGKKVKIKAKVTKYNEAIMDKNWAHIQDGTEFEGKFDLVVTSASVVKVGDVVLFEGTVVLNKDFGYGYKFDLMLENANVK